MTTATQNDTARQLLDQLQPPCEVTEQHTCGQPDQTCPNAAEWIDRYTCGCPTPGAILACDTHHRQLPRLIHAALVCGACLATPTLTSAERI